MPADRHAHLTTTLTTLPRLDPDVALVRQFQATGNPALFEALFRKYQTPIFHLVTRMVNGEEAYDLTQEVFLRALRALSSFKGDCKFRTWLYTIAKNTCLNQRREARKRAETEEYSLDETTEPGEAGGGPEPADPAADVVRIVETRELQRVVDRTLALLTPEQRLLITLRDLEGLSYEEIGEITELSGVNVKSKLHRARLAFKAQFQPYLALIRPDSEMETDCKKASGESDAS
jgi:RNA polymerase sigma-70 factor (ECF subfamily)